MASATLQIEARSDAPDDPLSEVQAMLRDLIDELDELVDREESKAISGERIVLHGDDGTLTATVWRIPNQSS